MMKRRQWLSMLWTIVGLAAALPAHAQATDGRLRLGTELSLLDIVGRGFTVRGSEEDSVEGSSSLGLGVGRVHLNVGYGLSDLLMLGTRLRLGGLGVGTERDGEEGPITTVGIFSIWPYLEFNLGDPEALHMFLGPMVGFNAYSVETKEADEDDPFESSDRGALGGGAVFGVRYFVGASAALEGTVQVRASGGGREEEFGDEKIEYDMGQFEIMLTVGGSLWFGGDSRPADAPPEEPKGSVYQHSAPPEPASGTTVGGTTPAIAPVPASPLAGPAGPPPAAPPVAETGSLPPASAPPAPQPATDGGTGAPAPTGDQPGTPPAESAPTPPPATESAPDTAPTPAAPAAPVP